METWEKSPNFLRSPFLYVIITTLYLIFYFRLAVLSTPNYSLPQNYQSVDMHSPQSLNCSQKAFIQAISFQKLYESQSSSLGEKKIQHRDGIFRDTLTMF